MRTYQQMPREARKLAMMLRLRQRIFQKKLDELKEVNRKIDNLMIVNKPKPVNTPVIKDEVYSNKRNVYVNKLNEGHIKYPKKRNFGIL